MHFAFLFIIEYYVVILGLLVREEQTQVKRNIVSYIFLDSTANNLNSKDILYLWRKVGTGLPYSGHIIKI